MIKRIFLLFLLSSCSLNNINNISNVNFSENLTFNEFKNLLEIYVKESEYPNIDW